MAGSIRLSDFRAQCGDVARPNRFWVSIVGGKAASKWKDTPNSYLCTSAQLPSRTIGEVNLKWFGMNADFAGDPTFDTITLTFHNDYDWKIRTFWEDWLEEIANQESNERSDPSTYLAQINLEQLGRTQNEVLATYQLNYAQPKNVSSIELNHDTSDTGESFTVTIKYDYFTKS